MKLKKKIISRCLNRPIRNLFNSFHSKRALVSYIPMAYRKRYHHHTNYIEANVIAEVLNELGYIVDVIHFNSNKAIDFNDYDLIVGFGSVFKKYLESNSKKIITITYATGMENYQLNNATLTRLKEVQIKKGLWIRESSRYLENFNTHQTTVVDAIISLGNETAANTYSNRFNGPVYALPAPYFKVLDANEIIKNRSYEDTRKSYLWFGGAGLIHKGLDLCLDYFSVHPELTLHVCADFSYEKTFFEVYYSELNSCSNIHYYGFVDIQSSSYQSILEKCSFIVFPSCSEGGSPSVINTIGNGGLIPIISKECSISIAFDFLVDELSFKGLDHAIAMSQKLSKEEWLSIQEKNLNYVEMNNSISAYKKNMSRILDTILFQSNSENSNGEI